MADTGINARQKYSINGVEVNASNEWQDVTISADYSNNAIQPSISIGLFTFSAKAKQVILDWIAGGNIFEGLPIEITLFNNKPQQETFKSLLDFNTDYTEFLDDGTLEISLMKDGGINSFFEKIEAISYGWLENIGVISNSNYINFDYVVEKRYSPLDIIILGLTSYVLIKETAELIEKTSKDQATATGISSSSATGSIGATIYTILIIIINVIYAAAILIAIINLINTVFEILLPPRRTHKLTNMRELLRVVCSYYGYALDAPASIFTNTYYLPSNINTDKINSIGIIERTEGTKKGIPNSGDIGYIVSDMFDTAKKMIDGKFAIINNTVVLRSKDDPYWIQTADYELADILINQKSYNLDELIGTRLVTFITDLNDEFTIDNYRGTAVEVRTDIANPINNTNNLIKGYEEVNFGLALGNRKQSLNAVEKNLQALASVADGITRLLGQRSRFAARIKSRVGLLKVTNNWNAIPKLLYIRGGSIPSNHREILSAPGLYNSYYGDTSFVRNNFRGQKEIYKNYKVPFGLEDYKKLSKNSYFKFAGKEAKITNFEWNMENDFATIDFEVRSPYCKNLKETKIIPE